MNEHNERYLWNCITNGDYTNLQIFLDNNPGYKNYKMTVVPPLSYAFILSAFKTNIDTIEFIGDLLNDFNLLSNYESNIRYIEICFLCNYIMDCNSKFSHVDFYDYYFNILKENVFNIYNESPEDFLNKMVEYVNLHAGYHFIFLWRRQKIFSSDIMNRFNSISKKINKYSYRDNIKCPHNSTGCIEGVINSHGLLSYHILSNV